MFFGYVCQGVTSPISAHLVELDGGPVPRHPGPGTPGLRRSHQTDLATRFEAKLGN